MSLLVVGSVAIDSIRTPWGCANGILGGSATYASVAASLFTKVALVGVVGKDFPASALAIFDRCGIDRRGLTMLPGGTFRWKGRYDEEGQAVTLSLDLGVFANFKPKLIPEHRKLPYAFLGNIQPDLQLAVLRQMTRPRLSACDSRHDWIKNDRRRFIEVLKKVDLVFLNDDEARELTGLRPLIQATKALVRFGPRMAIVKKGEHGVLAASSDHFASVPAFPVHQVVDPTGAGDSFAGACLGVLIARKKKDWRNFCEALQIASGVASLTIESFGTVRLATLTRKDLSRRTRSFRSLAHAFAT